MAAFETLPIRAEIFIPENKVSAWVSKKGDTIAKDSSKEFQGVWVADGYTLNKRKPSTEIWIFYDDDEKGIDRRVLENNPLQGSWGYAPGVNPRKAGIQDMWFFPPASARCKIPAQVKEYNHKGTWIKPVFKRDFSQLGANSSGFMTVSGNMRIAKGEKHSIGGKWNMLGFNDDVVRGKEKKKTDEDDKRGPFEIFVRKVDGTRFPISVIPGNKISDCKKKIHSKKRIPIEDQRLSFKEAPLRDMKTVVGSGIRNRDTIDLGPMIVYVRTRKGKKFTFEVDQDELVENLKQLVEPREGTPVDEQRLYFKNDKLKDGKVLSDYKIRHKSTIDLGPMIIFVQPNGDRPKIELDVDPKDTLKSVKTKVKNRSKIPVADQRLYFEKEEMFSNSKDLLSYNVHHLDTLFMHDDSTPELENKPGMIIFVIKEWNNHKFKIRTEPTNTILDIKKMIEASENIPVDEQRLTFKKKSVYNTKTLEQSKIKNRSILNLGKPRETTRKPPEETPTPMEVTLPDKSRVTIPVLPSKTFSDIKDEIENTYGIPKNKQRLFFMDEDKEPDEGAPISDHVMDSPKPMELRMDPDFEPIEVKTQDGRSFFMDFDPENDTVDDLKQKVAKLAELPVKDMELTDPDDEIVDDDNNLPKHGVLLNVAPQVDVILPDKTKVKISMLPKMTFDDLKDVIEEKTGTPKADQRIFFFDDEGNEMDDSTPMTKAGIEPDFLLEMRPPPPPPEEEKIEVRTPDGRSFHFDFDPEKDTGDDVKSEIAHLFGVPVKDLPPLMLDDEELDEDYRPSRGDILDFEQTEMEVELPDNRRIKLGFLPIQTIGEIKNIVEEKTGVPRAEQRIFYFDSPDKEIDDDQMLMKAKIPTGGALKVFPPLENTPKEIKIKDPSGRIFHFVIEPEESVQDLKERIRQKIGIPVGCFKLEDGSWDDIDDDIPLDTGRVMRNGGVLEIEPPEIEVALPNSRKIKIKILPTMTMQDINDIIEEEAPELTTTDNRQRVFFFDESQELDDETPFSKLTFNHGQTLEMRSMKIKVKHWDGRSFDLDVQTNWYVDDIRDKIHGLANVAPESQYLSFNGELVNEEFSLIKQGIVHDSTLILEPMMIYVRVPQRQKPLRLIVKEKDTVLLLKLKAVKKVRKEKKLSTGNYCLMIGGQELANKDTVGNCNIQHEDQLTLEEFKVRMMHWSGDMIDLDGIERSSTIASIKKQIHKSEGIPIDIQKISADGRPLDDSKTLKEEKVKHRTTLVLEPPDADLEMTRAEKRNVKTTKMKRFKSEFDEIMPVMPDWKRRIFFFDYESQFDAHVELVIMHWTGNKFTLENILLKQKVKEIKKLIYKREGIRRNKQIIQFNGKILDDKRTLLDQNVGHRSILILESPKKNTIAAPSVERLNGIFSTMPTKFVTNINIRVEHWNGDTFDLRPAPNDYIDDVKDSIYDLQRISQEHLRISFNGRPTEDDMNLKEQGIVDGSILVLEPMQIIMELPNNKKPITLNVEMEQTISQIKKRIAKKYRLHLESLCVMFGGNELENSKTLAACGVEHEDRIRVQTYEIQIMHWSGEKFSIHDMSPKFTTYDLKGMIAEVQSVPLEQQTLIFKGKILNDVLRLKDQGVHHKAILMLDPPDRVLSPIQQKVKLTLFTDTKSEEGENGTGGSRDIDKVYFGDLRESGDFCSSDDSLSIRSSSTKSSTSKTTSTVGSSSSSKKRVSKEKKEKKKSKSKKSKSEKSTSSTKGTSSRSSSLKRKKDSKKNTITME